MQASPDMQELMALVGHLLLRWGWLEHGLRGAPVPDELMEVRRLRNSICHGLSEASADGVASFIRCREFDGTVVEFSAAELDDAIRTLERVGHRYK